MHAIPIEMDKIYILELFSDFWDSKGECSKEQSKKDS
jgi:hypothetical protein